MITLNNVYKEVKGRNILTDINLLLGDCGIYLVKGDNGAGKSSLLSIIGLVDNKYQGSMYFNNQNFRDDVFSFKRTKYRKEHISFLTAKDNLISGISVEANLNFYSDKPFALPFSDIDLKEKSVNLTDGEEQIVALIREIKSDRNIMLLDEITSYLDDAKTKWVLDQLDRLSKERLIVFATHDERVFFNGARTVNLENGIIRNSNNR